MLLISSIPIIHLNRGNSPDPARIPTAPTPTATATAAVVFLQPHGCDWGFRGHGAVANIAGRIWQAQLVFRVLVDCFLFLVVGSRAFLFVFLGV